MTRINCVNVQALSPKHLVAEYRELPRVYALAVAAHRRGVVPSELPGSYRLGAGHVSFFYARLDYIRHRHGRLIGEMLRRGFAPTYQTVPAMDELPEPWHADWRPRKIDRELNMARLIERDNDGFYR